MLDSYKPSDAFKPSFNDSNEAVNQQKDASNNQSSLSLPLENSSLSELSSPENFHGFSSVPHCRLGK